MPLTVVRPMLAVALCAALSACGQVAELKPKAGHAMPPVPYGRDAQPGSGELLAPASQNRPGRSVEKHIRSEQRADDPFDLPPQTVTKKQPATPAGG